MYNKYDHFIRFVERKELRDAFSFARIEKHVRGGMHDRPTEVDLLLGDPSKARQRLGWWHKTSFEDLVREMVDADLAHMRCEEIRHSRYD